MMIETDPNSFTQKDLMLHLLHAAQHSVTREEMANQFALAEKINQERFEMLNKQFERVDKQFEQAGKLSQESFSGLRLEIKALNTKYDRTLWALFSGMLAIFFKDFILGALA